MLTYGVLTPEGGCGDGTSLGLFGRFGIVTLKGRLLGGLDTGGPLPLHQTSNGSFAAFFIVQSNDSCVVFSF